MSCCLFISSSGDLISACDTVTVGWNGHWPTPGGHGETGILRACSGVMIAPGQVLPRVCMMICCPESTSLPRGKFILI